MQFKKVAIKIYGTRKMKTYCLLSLSYPPVAPAVAIIPQTILIVT